MMAGEPNEPGLAKTMKRYGTNKGKARKKHWKGLTKGREDGESKDREMQTTPSMTNKVDAVRS
jgi:hypothetical protein